MKDERLTASVDLAWTSQEGFIAAKPAPKGRRLRLPFLATHLLVLLCFETTLSLALIGQMVRAGDVHVRAFGHLRSERGAGLGFAKAYPEP